MSALVVTRRRLGLTFPLVVLACSLQVPAVVAQDVSYREDPITTPGWSFTPAIDYGQVLDDNVLMQGKNAAPPGDLLSLVSPQAGLDFNGSRGHLSADYRGLFELYRQFDSLNNYGQFETLTARRLMTSHTSLFVQQQFSLTPTTALPALVGVPFVRVGSRVLDSRAGFDHAFTKRTTLTASYDFQWISFDQNPVFGPVLIGGRGEGATAEVRHRTTAKTTLIVKYEAQHASLIDNSAFTVQNARGGAEHKLSATWSVFGEAGIAHLNPSALSPGATGPSVEAGVARGLPGSRGSVDITYARGYVPSFGNGDPLRSDDFGSHLKVTLVRRVSAQGALDWRRVDPLIGTFAALGEQTLRSLWVSGLVSYAANPQLRIEGFFSTSRQKVSRAGGDVNDNRVGIQVVTAKPMRIR
jgi:hypothetical protein